MINNINEKGENKANELMEQHYELLNELGEKTLEIGKITDLEGELAKGNIGLKKMLAKAYYEKGEVDKAIDMLQGVPMDNEVRELHRALRYADEAKGIVSNVNPETEKYFADLAGRLGIKAEKESPKQEH